jgi:hypothetical protein
VTKAEYLDRCVKFGYLSQLFADHVNVPEFLRTMAQVLFLKGDCSSDMALETRLRLNELLETGILTWEDK